MIQNYYTLIKLTNELKKLVGMKVLAAFSQASGTITFSLFDGSKETFLNFSGTLFIYNNMVRAKNNTANLCPEIVNDVLQNIDLISGERIIELHFINYKLICHVFGGSNANLFLCNNNNKILFALNNTQNIVDTKYNPTEHAFHNNVPNDNIQIIDYLTKYEFLFGKPYAMQFCYINGYAQNNAYERKINKLSAEEFRDLKQKAIEFSNYLTTQPQCYIVKAANSNTSIFSLIPLDNYEIIRTYDSISDAIKYQIVQNLIERQKNDILKELLPKLRRDYIRTTKSIQFTENIQESLQRADLYRGYAELLISQPEQKQKYSNSITLKDWQNNEQTIALDPKLTLVENANKYFVKSRKATKEAKCRKERLPFLKLQLQKIQTAIDRINETQSIKELVKIRSEFIKKSIVIMQSEERPINTKFRTFDIGEGYTVYVGKNATNNDELTMNFAKPNDIWLHAKSCSGSHCVVKGGDSSGKLPKHILTKAAEIAAYYSSAKGASYTPVVYTQKKYVRKPKGAKPGAVILQKETTIMVAPNNSQPDPVVL